MLVRLQDCISRLWLLEIHNSIHFYTILYIYFGSIILAGDPMLPKYIAQPWEVRPHPMLRAVRSGPIPTPEEMFDGLGNCVFILGDRIL